MIESDTFLMVGWMLPLTFGTCTFWGWNPSYCFDYSHFFQCLLAYRIPLAFLGHRYHFLSHFVDEELRLREVHYLPKARYMVQPGLEPGFSMITQLFPLPTPASSEAGGWGVGGSIHGKEELGSQPSLTGRFSYSRQGQVMVQPSRRIWPLGGFTFRPPSSL